MFVYIFTELKKVLRAESFTSLMANLRHLPSALMEHFLEEIALLRHWYINPNEKRNKYKSSLLS